MGEEGDLSVEGKLGAREYDWTETSPSVAVVTTVATLENMDPVDLTPLYEYIDPDSLDTLLTSGDDVSLSFSAYGYSVNIVGSTVIIFDS